MSEMKNFDEHLRKSFSGYSPDVPAHIWENIAAARKKRRPAGWWLNKKFLGAAVVLSAILTGSILLFNNTGDIHREAIVSKNTSVIHDQKTRAVLKENTTSTAITPANKQERNVQLLTDHSINQDYSSAMGQNHTNIPINKYANRKSLIAISKHNQDRSHAGNGLVADQTQQIVRETKQGTQSSENTQEISGVKDRLPAPDFLATSLYFNAEKLTAVSLADTRKPELKAIKIPGCPPNKDAAGDKQYWEIYAGPDYAIKKYNDTANSVLLEKRKASTSFQYAFSAGIRYTRVFNNGMSLRAGLNYSQVNEKFSYVESNVVQVIYEISPNGDTLNSYNVRGTKYKTTYNHYRTVDLPVMIGYELGNGKLHANINAGPVINIYSWQKGETLDTTLQPVSFSSGKSSAAYQYKTNVGVGFIGAVSVYYKLDERLHLLAEPYYRYNFSPINKEDLSIQERFSTIGLRLGLRVDL